MVPLDRREFVKVAGALATQQLIAASMKAKMTQDQNGMIYRTLGRTGERVSAIGLGGTTSGSRRSRSRILFN